MNIVLWILQGLLALHTAIGAVWKLSNPEQTVPSLSAIPHALWLVLSPLELLCSLVLVAAAVRPSMGRWVPIAAAAITAEMLVFCGVHLASGAAEHGELIYWLVVAALSGFVAVGRRTIHPHGA